MHVVRAAEAPTFSLPGFRFTGLTAPSRGASELCTWYLTAAGVQGSTEEGPIGTLPWAQ
jgi:hypothetical protein